MEPSKVLRLLILSRIRSDERSIVLDELIDRKAPEKRIDRARKNLEFTNLASMKLEKRYKSFLIKS